MNSLPGLVALQAPSTPPLWSDAWRGARRLLCVRLDSLGDLLMTAPALRALKYSVRGRRITLLTSPAGAAAAGLLPDVDEVLVYEAPWMKATPARTDSAPELAMISTLRRGAFDGAVIFTVFSQSPLPAALLCSMADIPLRLACCRENPYQLLTHWLPEHEPEAGIRHDVRRQLDLVRAVGAAIDDERIALRVPEDARQRVQRVLLRLGVDLDQPWILIHPGASAPSRRYPPEGFAAVARLLAGERGLPVVFCGGPDEQALVADIRDLAGIPTMALPCHLDLAELAALIALAPALIANNSAPAHIAAAVGTPVVDLYALTNPQHTPWMAPSRVLSYDVPCKNCFKSVCPEGHHRCLRGIDPREVVVAVLELLEETRRPWAQTAGCPDAEEAAAG